MRTPHAYNGICTDFRADHPADDFFIVSNKVAALSDTMTHAAARGSNELIGRNVIQTMTFMPPDEYEKLQVLNAWTGRSDLVGLRHIDEFDQTMGRSYFRPTSHVIAEADFLREFGTRTPG